jgi:acyl-CoA synthetase (AMP-forming)/AMP-acid ligase II
LGHVEIQLRHPDTHQEVAPDEPGILYVRKHSNMIDGYYNDPAKTRTLYSADGDWATVGDIARKDSDGFYYICDRAIDMVISGGVNIYPREIEEALHRHPAVQDIAVFGLPDDTWGEKLHAAVVLQPGVEVDAKTLISFARTVLADYKIPREFSFHPAADFPRDHAGKIRKAVLRRHFLPPAAGAAGLAGLAAKL